MAKFKVLSKLVTAQGTFEPGATVEMPYETAGDKVDADKLISWGVVEEIATPAKPNK